MRVLLTGATGFIGARVLDFLLEMPQVSQVLCLGRDKHCDVAARPGIRWIHGDLTDASWWGDVDRVDVVIHAAANASYHPNADHETVNHAGTRGLLECARRSGAKHFIFFSSIGAVDRVPADEVDGPLGCDSPPAPTTAYGRSKLAAESAVRESGIPWTIIRPAWVYGEGMRKNSHLCVLANLARHRGLVARFDWPGRVSLVHVDDLSRGVATIAATNGCVNEVVFAAAESISLGDVFKCFGNAAGWAGAGRVPVPSRFFRVIVSRMHRFMPLSVANLFVDYLTCETSRFHELIHPHEPLTFRDRYADVLAVCDPLRKVWLVTGAGSGIGRALCAELSERGVRVIGVDREFPMPAPAGVSCRTVDVTGPNAVAELRDVVDTEGVAVVVNNAGVGYRGPFSAIAARQLEAMLAVNVAFPMRFTRAVLGLLARRRGTLVNVASSMAGVPLPDMCVYSASKGFMQAWSVGLASEVEESVNVLTVAPAGTNTNFQRTAGVAGGQKTLLHPDHVAAAIIRAVVAGRKYCFVGPWRNRAAMFLVGLLPLPLQSKVWGFLFGRLR